MPPWLAILLIGGILLVALFAWVQEWRNRRQADPDQAVLAHLRAAGSKLERPHAIDFFLLFRARESAEAAARELGESGYTIAPVSSNEGAWVCQASRSLVPDIGTLKELRAGLGRTAARFNGVYDGWGAGVVR